MRPGTRLLTFAILSCLLVIALPATADQPDSDPLQSEQGPSETPCTPKIAATSIYLGLQHRSLETITTTEPLCFASRLPAEGYWLIEAISDSPSADRLRIDVQSCGARTVFRTLNSALVAFPKAGTGAFCIQPAPDFDSLAHVGLSARFVGDFGKSDPDELETDPDPAPVPPPRKAALPTSPDFSRAQVQALCERHELISLDSELCAPRLDREANVAERLTESEVHSYQLAMDHWSAVRIDWAGESGQTIELLGPQGHTLARSDRRDSPLFETLGPGIYTLRVLGSGTYSVTWSGSELP